MASEFECPHCAARFRLEPGMAGRTLQCGGCGGSFLAPAAPPPLARPAPPLAHAVVDEEDEEDEDDEPAPRPAAKRARRRKSKGLPAWFGGAAFGTFGIVGVLAVVLTVAKAVRRTSNGIGGGGTAQPAPGVEVMATLSNARVIPKPGGVRVVQVDCRYDRWPVMRPASRLIGISPTGNVSVNLQGSSGQSGALEFTLNARERASGNMRMWLDRSPSYQGGERVSNVISINIPQG